MEKLLKKSSWTDVIISILFILFGIMIIARPDTIMSVISLLLGAICIVMGILKGIDYFSSGKTDNYSLAVAVISIIAGVIIMFCSNIIFSVFRIVIAIWIIYSGLMDLQTTIIWKDYKSKLWLLTLILAILMIIGGVYILINNGAMLQIIGTIIIVYGAIDIIENVVFIKKVENYLD